MAKTQIAHRPRQSLEPLSPILFVSDEGVTVIPVGSATPERVGEKAFGLSSLPKSWTLPFIAVSDELLSQYLCRFETDRDQLLDRWITNIVKAAFNADIRNQDPIIVRSSGCSEGMEERGQFYSTKGQISNVLEPLTQCLQKLASDKDLNKQRIPLVIQKYAIPISAKGHLSNERRFSEENRDWLGEFEEIEKIRVEKNFKINLRHWRRNIRVGSLIDKPLTCNLSGYILEVLKIPAEWGYGQGLRLHFEWVWDGKTIYLVQADQEKETSGTDPKKIHKSRARVSSEFVPKCLKKINEANASRYEKVRNVFTYMKLDLPVANLYILDDQSVINDLALGKASSALEADLLELVKGSLVIRTDIATDDRTKCQLLPRTHEVRDLHSALTWLKETSSVIKGHETQDDVAFIFHNFVPAVSSAFALAVPGERKVQIEALWGLPEGLYYNAHDKYIVDTRVPQGKRLRDVDIDRFEVQQKYHFKRYFVAPDADGRWTTQTLKSPYDWCGSIPKTEWVKKIALESRRIAEMERKPLSIMWFVGVPKDFCPRPIFPWYHEFFDSRITSRALTQRTKTLFDKSLIIRTNAEIEILRQEATNRPSNIRRIRIQPLEEALLRDKNTLRMIGELAKKIDAVILLEGGVLSHAYYQLMETKAIVEVLHPFKDLEDKQEFNKLVRDKVPINIEQGGEVVTTKRLSGQFYLRALREKLVEEAFEVMDASDDDSILGELADLSEIIDAILSQIGVKRGQLRERQNKKREKTGGFKEGIVLMETQNPVPTKKAAAIGNDTLFLNPIQSDARKRTAIGDREIIELGHSIDKWSDRREHQTATEVILRLVIPMVRDSWSVNTLETAKNSDLGNIERAKLTGIRLGSKLRIELSIFSKRQLKLL